MIVGLGIDIVEIARVRNACQKYGERFLRKFLTPQEMALCPKNSLSYYAGRFAAKEAGAKALGTGFSDGISACQIETFTNGKGVPCMRFLDQAAIRAARMGVSSTHLSITHEKNMAAAIVILEA